MKKLIISFVFLLLTLSCIGGLNNQTAFALTSEGYSSVTSDLSKDVSFSASEYPYVGNDFSIKVIQIAPDNQGNLFVYTYQPCQPTTFLTASEISMNFAYAANPHIYGLVLVSSENTLCKYKVTGTTYIPNDGVNYVNITSISRPWNSAIDSQPAAGTTTNTVAFAVGQIWHITSANNYLTYKCEQSDVVEIINPFVGYLEYNNGFYLAASSHCRSHFVAFSTDHQIDELQEATVYYKSCVHSQHYDLLGMRDIAGEVVSSTVVLDGTQTGSNNPNIFGKHYEWKRIQTVANFIESEELTSSATNSLNTLQWVLRFIETPVNVATGTNTTTIQFTDISEVTILRLKFVTAGKTYNLGAVMNKTTGDNIADNTNTDEYASAKEAAQNIWNKIKGWFEQLADGFNIPLWAVYAIAIVLAVVVLGVVLSTIFPGIIIPIIKAIFQAIFWIISLPFKAIAALIDRL